MATKKPTKSGKKPVAKPESTKVKSVKTEKASAQTPAITSKCESPMKGFFAKKYEAGENIVTIFKTPKIWGAVLGEIIGTMLITMLMLTLTVNPLYLVIGLVGVYAIVLKLSGANLNPIITVGLMASRRMSAIRGVLYMLSQLLGAWIGLIIINAFRLSSGTTTELPMAPEVTTETFMGVAMLELLGAVIFAFVFARAIRFAKKQPLAFAVTVTSGLTLVAILGLFIAQGFYYTQYSYIFNPAVALMYQILPATAEGIGELAATAGLALAAYVVVPVVGGVLGFYISDVVTRLAAGGYTYDYDAPCCCKDAPEVCKK